MPAKKVVPLRLFKAWQQVPKGCADMAAAKAEAVRDHRWLTPMYVEASALVMLFPDGAMADCYSKPQPFLLTVQPVEPREFYVWRRESDAMALEPRWRVLVRADPYGAARNALARGAKAYVFARTYLAPYSADAAQPLPEAAE